MKLEDYYREIRLLIKVILKSENPNSSCVFLLGGRGLGKSYQVHSILSKNNVNYIFISGHITPLGLYKQLYEIENSNYEIVVFDDVQSLLENYTSLNLLMQTLWTVEGKRKISWISSSDKLDIPSSFPFTKKVIFILNKIPKNHLVDTMLSRTKKLTVKFNYSELLNIMHLIAEKPSEIAVGDRRKIVEFIEQHTSEATPSFSLRLQNHIEDIFLSDKKNWKEIALSLIEDSNPLLRKVLHLIKKNKTLKEAEEEFVNKKYGCRRTFYNLKKELYGK